MSEPKKSITLTLKFESKKLRDDWQGWYLDGGGEQQAEFYAQHWTKDEMYLEYIPEDSADDRHA